MFATIRHDFDGSYFSRGLVAVLVATSAATGVGVGWMVFELLSRVAHLLLAMLLGWWFPPNLVVALSPVPPLTVALVESAQPTPIEAVQLHLSEPMDAWEPEPELLAVPPPLFTEPEPAEAYEDAWVQDTALLARIIGTTAEPDAGLADVLADFDESYLDDMIVSKGSTVELGTLLAVGNTASSVGEAPGEGEVLAAIDSIGQGHTGGVEDGVVGGLIRSVEGGPPDGVAGGSAAIGDGNPGEGAGQLVTMGSPAVERLRLLTHVAPEITDEAIEYLELHGSQTCVAKVKVAASGALKRTRLSSCPGPLGPLVQEALDKTVFAPEQRGGRPVDAEMELRFRFKTI